MHGAHGVICNTPGTFVSVAGDFVSLSVELILTSSSVRQCGSIVIHPDAILEVDEAFTAQLSSSDPRVMITAPTSDITILNNDNVTVSLQAASYNIQEGNSTQIFAELTGSSERTVAVTLTTFEGTAGNVKQLLGYP